MSLGLELQFRSQTGRTALVAVFIIGGFVFGATTVAAQEDEVVACGTVTNIPGKGLGNVLVQFQPAATDLTTEDETVRDITAPGTGYFEVNVHDEVTYRVTIHDIAGPDDRGGAVYETELFTVYLDETAEGVTADRCDDEPGLRITGNDDGKVASYAEEPPTDSNDLAEDVGVFHGPDTELRSIGQGFVNVTAEFPLVGEKASDHLVTCGRLSENETDARGRAYLGCRSGEREVTVEGGPGYQDHGSDPQVSPNNETEVDAALWRDAKVRPVQVTEVHTGKSLAGVDVQVTETPDTLDEAVLQAHCPTDGRVDSSSGYRCGGITHGNGTLTLFLPWQKEENLDSTSYKLRVSDPLYQDVKVRFDVNKDTEETTLGIDLIPFNISTVSGTTKKLVGAGNPDSGNNLADLSGVQVSFKGPMNKSVTADPTFQVSLINGLYEVQLNKDGYEPRSYTIRVEDGSVDYTPSGVEGAAFEEEPYLMVRNGRHIIHDTVDEEFGYDDAPAVVANQDGSPVDVDTTRDDRFLLSIEPGEFGLKANRTSLWTADPGSGSSDGGLFTEVNDDGPVSFDRTSREVTFTWAPSGELDRLTIGSECEVEAEDVTGPATFNIPWTTLDGTLEAGESGTCPVEALYRPPEDDEVGEVFRFNKTDVEVPAEEPVSDKHLDLVIENQTVLNLEVVDAHTDDPHDPPDRTFRAWVDPYWEYSGPDIVRKRPSLEDGDAGTSSGCPTLFTHDDHHAPHDLYDCRATTDDDGTAQLVFPHSIRHDEIRVCVSEYPGGSFPEDGKNAYRGASDKENQQRVLCRSAADLGIPQDRNHTVPADEPARFELVRTTKIVEVRLADPHLANADNDRGSIFGLDIRVAPRAGFDCFTDVNGDGHDDVEDDCGEPTAKERAGFGTRIPTPAKIEVPTPVSSDELVARTDSGSADVVARAPDACEPATLSIVSCPVPVWETGVSYAPASENVTESLTLEPRRVASATISGMVYDAATSSNPTAADPVDGNVTVQAESQRIGFVCNPSDHDSPEASDDCDGERVGSDTSPWKSYDLALPNQGDFVADGVNLESAAPGTSDRVLHGWHVFVPEDDQYFGSRPSEEYYATDNGSADRDFGLWPKRFLGEATLKGHAGQSLDCETASVSWVNLEKDTTSGGTLNIRTADADVADGDNCLATFVVTWDRTTAEDTMGTFTMVATADKGPFASQGESTQDRGFCRNEDQLDNTENPVVRIGPRRNEIVCDLAPGYPFGPVQSAQDTPNEVVVAGLVEVPGAQATDSSIKVVAKARDGPSFRSTITDADGTYMLELPHGDYDLWAVPLEEKDGREARLEEVTVRKVGDRSIAPGVQVGPTFRFPAQR